MAQDEGCRAGRQSPRESIAVRLARRDQARRDLRTRQMRGASNWPNVA